MFGCVPVKRCMVVTGVMNCVCASESLNKC
jgi:hypothetical protein